MKKITVSLAILAMLGVAVGELSQVTAAQAGAEQYKSGSADEAVNAKELELNRNATGSGEAKGKPAETGKGISGKAQAADKQAMSGGEGKAMMAREQEKNRNMVMRQEAKGRPSDAGKGAVDKAQPEQKQAKAESASKKEGGASETKVRLSEHSGDSGRGEMRNSRSETRTERGGGRSSGRNR